MILNKTAFTCYPSRRFGFCQDSNTRTLFNFSNMKIHTQPITLSKCQNIFLVNISPCTRKQGKCKKFGIKLNTTDNYAKDGGPGEVWLLCSFYHDPLSNWIKANVNKFAISNHTSLKLGIQALRSYLKLICEYEFHTLLNIAKDHGKNYMKVRPPLVSHLLRNRTRSKTLHFSCMERPAVRMIFWQVSSLTGSLRIFMLIDWASEISASPLCLNWQKKLSRALWCHAFLRMWPALLVPRTEHHLSSFKCGFLNIFRAKTCCVVCHAYCFCYCGTNMARKNVWKEPHSIRLLRWCNISQSGSRKNNRKAFERASMEPTKL